MTPDSHAAQLAMTPSEIKIAYLGGGSRDWARKLMIDLALSPELCGHVALYDIDPDAARLNQELGTWIQARPEARSRWRYSTTTSLDSALQGADFVVLSIQPGPLELMAEEIAIAAEFGLFFPVGDTTGAPGLMRGLRAAAIYAGFAEAIARVCPTAWVINYTNPMAICTRTLTRVAPDLKVFGCCHEVFSTQRMLAALVSQYLDVHPAPARTEIQVNVLGINHFTWVDQAAYEGQDLLALLRAHVAGPGVLRSYSRQEVESWNDWFRSADQVKLALFDRFGILPAAGDRHLVEFLPGFIRSEDELFRWGVIRTPVGWRIQRWRRAPAQARGWMTGERPFELKASDEEGVAQMKALLGLGTLKTNVNLENRGQVSNLPEAVVVETNALFERDRVRPLAAGALPAWLAALIGRHCTNQELIISAALQQDRELAFQAVYNDPTNSLPLDQTWELFDRMYQAGRRYAAGWSI
jgi:alpha-galactosidase